MARRFRAQNLIPKWRSVIAVSVFERLDFGEDRILDCLLHQVIIAVRADAKADYATGGNRQEESEGCGGELHCDFALHFLWQCS